MDKMTTLTFEEKIKSHNLYGRYFNLRQHFIDCMNILIDSIRQDDESAIKYAHKIIMIKIVSCYSNINIENFNMEKMLANKNDIILCLTNWVENYKKL